jgi:hypothetical protein
MDLCIWEDSSGELQTASAVPAATLYNGWIYRVSKDDVTGQLRFTIIGEFVRDPEVPPPPTARAPG